MIYNFPGVVAGLDVNSDMFSRLGKHPNIVGCKLTCGGIAKVSRIRAEFEPTQFFAMTGQSDWLVPGMSVGATGVVTGVANLWPKVCPDFPRTALFSADGPSVLRSHLRSLPGRQAPGGVRASAEARAGRVGVRQGRHQRDEMGCRQVQGV